MEGYCASAGDTVKLKLSIEDIQRFNSGAFPQLDGRKAQPVSLFIGWTRRNRGHVCEDARQKTVAFSFIEAIPP